MASWSPMVQGGEAGGSEFLLGSEAAEQEMQESRVTLQHAVAELTPPEPKPFNLLGVIGYASLAYNVLSCGHVHLVLAQANAVNSSKATVLVFTVMSCTGILILSLGMSRLHRARMVPDGCEGCYYCWRNFPQTLLVLSAFECFWNFINVLGSPSARFDGLIWFDMGAALCNRLCVIVFAVHWICRLSKQSRDADAEESGSLTGATQDNSRSSPAQRFVEQLAKENRKFEIAIIISEWGMLAFLAIAAPDPYGYDDQKKQGIDGKQDVYTNVYVLAVFLLWRLCRCFTGMKLNRRADLLCTAFDAVNFAYYAYLCALWKWSWLSFMPLVLNIIVSFMVIFVWSVRRSLFVAPIAFATYSIFCIHAFMQKYVYNCKGEHACEEAIREYGTTTGAEVIILWMGFCLSISAKRVIESSKWQMFCMVEEKTKQALDEKVLRFQAEFSRDFDRDARLNPNAPQHEQASGAEARGADQPSGAPVKARAAVPTPSLHSAPTVLDVKTGQQRVAKKGLEFQDPGMCDNPQEGDCLLADSLAWVENRAQPSLLEDLKKGDRVLCYDRLGATFKHASLLDVQKVEGSVKWVDVTLEDGTSLKMTSDHPVQPSPADATSNKTMGPHTRPLPLMTAGQLQPGEHSLMVLKMLPIVVKTVEEQEAANTRMMLTVQQPERHAIFVAPPGERDGTIQSIAVESANAMDSGALRIAGGKRTFLDVVEEGAPSGARERSSSAPPGLHGAENVQRLKRLAWADVTDLSSRGDPSEIRTVSDDCETWTCSSVSGASTMSHGRNIIVGSSLAPAKTKDGEDVTVISVPGDAPTKLTDLLLMKASNYRSMGSTDHRHQNCKVCAHHNKWMYYGGQGGGATPCFKGALCERCHEDHADRLSLPRSVRRGRKGDGKSR